MSLGTISRVSFNCGDMIDANLRDRTMAPMEYRTNSAFPGIVLGYICHVCSCHLRFPSDYALVRLRRRMATIH
jgi:hypothetical protein